MKRRPSSSSHLSLSLLCLFLTFVNIVNCQQDDRSQAPANTCIMSSRCGSGQFGPKPCAQISSPARLTDSKDLELLKEMCPSFADGPVCCGVGQLQDMKKNIQLILSFNKCAPCLNNFLDLFCHSTCSPYQNQFLKITKTSKADKEFDKSQTKLQVDAIIYSITLDSVNTFFNSCSKASSSALGSSFLDFFPSSNGPELLYAIQSNSPFGIDFNLFDGDRTFHLVRSIPDDEDSKLIERDVPRINKPITPDFKDCDQASRNNETCRCAQCAKLDCPVVPGVIEPTTCTLFGVLSCCSLAIAVVYILLLLASVVFFVMYLRRRSKPDEKDNEILDDDEKSPTNQGLGSRMEAFFALLFERWTRFCVRYPFIVILLGLIMVTWLTLGLLNFTVISDPVELWSSPESVSRQQREFYNQKFNPFFRIQQVIIKNVDDSVREDPEFSNLFNYEFMQEAMRLQESITSLNATYDNETVTLNDICYQPMNNGECAVQSPFTWFQENPANFAKDSYKKKLTNCFTNFFNDRKCFGSFGGPAFPYVVLGGFDEKEYQNATSLIITILINNHVNEKDNAKAMAWEELFLQKMEEYTESLPKTAKAKISYFSERSVGDELLRQSLSDVGTIAISYIIMFLYVSIALGQVISNKNLLIDSKVGLAIVGVLIVLASVSSSVGFLSLCGVKATLIIVEVIPFLVLAVGVDNIFIIVQTLNREDNAHNVPIEDKMANVMSKVGPSLLLAFISEVSCFFLGAMSSMPCIRIFALNAALALVFDFLLQMTVFLACLSLDAKRQREARYDILVCLKSKKSGVNEELNENQSMLYNFFNNIYAPWLMKDIVRYVVLVIFSLFFCIAMIVVKNVDVGLDQELSMPEDSYVNRYFLDQKSELRVGPPMFFVVKNSIDLSKMDNRKLFADYSDSSLVSLVNAKSLQNHSYIATGPNSWVDGYDTWMSNENCFQVYKSNMSFCASTVKNRTELCYRNEELFDNTYHLAIKIMKPEYYYAYFNDFLNDVPYEDCPYGGRAQYRDAVRVIENEKTNQTSIEASYFMAYHSVLQSSKDFVNALEDARLTSKYVQDTINKKKEPSESEVEVFAYSIFYVFYDQFLTMWKDAILSLTLSLGAIMLVTFVMLGFDLRNALIAMFTLVSILFNILSVMYWWDISLNAVSLVNLVMSIGISVEFCSHILHHYCTNSRSSSKLRAQNALAKMGSSVFSGIALTKFVGIVVLANSKSQIFQIFYFRMYLTIVLVGSTHGLILLPVLLSLFGGKAKLQTTQPLAHRPISPESN